MPRFLEWQNDKNASYHICNFFMRPKEKRLLINELSSVLSRGAFHIWSHFILMSAMWRKWYWLTLTDGKTSSVEIPHSRGHIACKQWSEYLSSCLFDSKVQFFPWHLPHSQVQTILEENSNICWFLSFFKVVLFCR